MLNLLHLLDDKPVPPDPESSPQLLLFEESLAAVPVEVPHLLPEIDEHHQAVIGRETFIASLVVHLVVILFLVTHPELINVGSAKIVPLKPEEKQVTMLYEPPPQRPKLPPVPVQPRTLPRAEGTRDSELEKLAPPPNQLKQPPQPRPQESPRGPDEREKQQTAQQTEPAGIPKFPELAKEPPGQKPSLESLPKLKENPPAEAQLRLPEITSPSRGTDSILREMAKQHAEGGGRGLGGTMSVPSDPNNPNFNLPGPQILSDTMGVNFDPYLLRVYLIVRRNWDSVIPQIAQLGRKGRVVLQFSIRKDGSVPDLQMMSGSGTQSMDTAALSSIKMSSPFPPLPAEFPGNDILLRFGYYYNMMPE